MDNKENSIRYMYCWDLSGYRLLTVAYKRLSKTRVRVAHSINKVRITDHTHCGVGMAGECAIRSINTLHRVSIYDEPSKLRGKRIAQGRLVCERDPQKYFEFEYTGSRLREGILWQLAYCEDVPRSVVETAGFNLYINHNKSSPRGYSSITFSASWLSENYFKEPEQGEDRQSLK